MLVIEGPDGSGKTTLANKLCTDLGLEYRRPPQSVLSSTQGPMSDELITWWQDEIEMPPEYRMNGCYDRTFCISEVIYRPAQQKLSRCSAEGMVKLTQRFSRVVNGIVFCLPTLGQMLRNIHLDGRDSLAGVSDTGLEIIWWMYHAQYALWLEAMGGSDVWRYDYQSDTYDVLRSEIDLITSRVVR